MRTAGDPAAELSCYTAALAGYMAGEYPDAVARLVGSIRLAVRADADGPAFSHHRSPAGLLADGTHLAYASATSAADALGAIGAQLAADSRVIVVGNSGHLPWSVGQGTARTAHWLLVDGRRTGSWHVVDDFAGLLPGGMQRPYAGWLDDAEFAAALSADRAAEPVHLARDRYAFGFALPAPAPDRIVWLVRGGTAPAATLAGEWRHGVDALCHLGDRLATLGAEAGRYADDVWTAARHYRYRLSWLVQTGAVAADAAVEARRAWRDLPMALRFAVDSARRGRPRAALLATTFDALAWIERELSVWPS